MIYLHLFGFRTSRRCFAVEIINQSDTRRRRLLRRMILHSIFWLNIFPSTNPSVLGAFRWRRVDRHPNPTPRVRVLVRREVRFVASISNRPRQTVWSKTSFPPPRHDTTVFMIIPVRARTPITIYTVLPYLSRKNAILNMYYTTWKQHFELIISIK